MMLGQWRKKFNDSKELHAPQRNNRIPFTYYIAQQKNQKEIIQCHSSLSYSLKNIGTKPWRD